MSVFVVGSGGFGGPRTSDACVAAADKMPSRSPDASKEFKTSLDQVSIRRFGHTSCSASKYKITYDFVGFRQNLGILVK